MLSPNNRSVTFLNISMHMFNNDDEPTCMYTTHYRYIVLMTTQASGLLSLSCSLMHICTVRIGMDAQADLGLHYACTQYNIPHSLNIYNTSAPHHVTATDINTGLNRLNLVSIQLKISACVYICHCIHMTHTTSKLVATAHTTLPQPRGEHSRALLRAGFSR